MPALAVLAGLSGILTCGSRRKVTSNIGMKLAAVARLPGDISVRYDDSTRLRPFTPSGLLYGVWFSPPRDGNYSLIEVNCYFGDSNYAETIPCFVNSVARYDNRSQLTDTGRQVEALQLIHSTGTRWTADLASPVPVGSNDFFIGWSDLTGAPITGLEDDTGSAVPPRSYVYTKSVESSSNLSEGLWPLDSDLAISAVFRPSGPVTAWLTWHTAANLDLQLIDSSGPRKDSIVYPRLRDTLGDWLNHDFRDSSGPEIITVPIATTRQDNNALIRVYFRGPSGIPLTSTTPAMVAIRRNSTLLDTISASLTPGDYWLAGCIFPKTGRFRLYRPSQNYVSKSP
jgi:hypothetical protein